VATHLPPEEIEGIRQMFMDLDADGSGTISFEELREGEGGVGWRRPGLYDVVVQAAWATCRCS
jgi:hypothetical protein